MDNIRRKTLRIKDVVISDPPYDPHPEKSTTGNHKWRKGLFIIFTDRYGTEYDWMPRWEELEKVNEMKDKVERINKELCKMYNEEENKNG